MWPAFALIPVGYLLGTFPSAGIVAKSRGVDITQEGSGNPGASNVLRVLGWRFGAMVMVADFAKGAIAAGLGLWVSDRSGAYLLGIAAVLGHTFPMLRKGGKGVAASGGMLIVLFPFVLLSLLVAWALISRLTHKASVASLITIAAFPISIAALGYAGWEVAVISGISLLLLLRHSGNIRRLLRREENALAPTPVER